MVAGFAALVGIVGHISCKSSTALHLMILSMGLGALWIAGYIASYRTRKELVTVNFRNLNGSINFEALIVFCQLQILALAVTVIIGLQNVTNLLVELSYLQVLNGKNGGEWE